MKKFKYNYKKKKDILSKIGDKHLNKINKIIENKKKKINTIVNKKKTTEINFSNK